MTQSDVAKSKVDDHDSAGAERTEKDWGLKPAKRGMGWGTKLGLLLVLAASGGFGYMVYKKLTIQQVEAAIANAEEAVVDEAKKDLAALAAGKTGETPAAENAPATTSPATTSPAAGKPDDPFEDKAEKVASLPVQSEPAPAAAEEIDLERLAARPAKAAAPARMPLPEQAEPAEAGLELAEPQPKKAVPQELLELEPTEPQSAAQPQLIVQPANKPTPPAVAAAPEARESPDLFPAAENAKTLDVETLPVEAEAPPKLQEPEALPKTPAVAKRHEKHEKNGVTLDGVEVVKEQEAISTIPAETPAAVDRDQRLGDYVEAPTSTRAVSKTVISRPEQPAAVPINPARPAAQLQGEIEVAAADQLSPPQPIMPAQPSTQAQPIMPRNSVQPESAPMQVIQRRVPPPTTQPASTSPLTLTPIQHEPRPRQLTPTTPATFSPGGELDAPAPRQPSASTSVPAGESYTVAPNDNFWKISRKQYGTIRYFAALTQHNKNIITDPTHMRPGMQVSTPPKEFLESNYPELIEGGSHRAETASAVSGGGGLDSIETTAGGETAEQTGFFVSETGEPMYRVGPDDTLTSISQRHLGRSSRWPEILEQNRGTLKSPDALKIGTVIRLPANASRLSVAPSPKERR